MPSLQTRVVQESFSAGMVRGVAPQLIAENGAYDIQNGLLNEDGSIFRRGGTTDLTTPAFGSGLTFIWNGFMEPGHRTLVAHSSDFGVLADDGETIINLGGAGMARPAQCAYLEGLLFIGGGYIYGGSRKAAAYTTTGDNAHVTADSKVVTDATGGFTANIDAGMLMQVDNGRIYVVDSVDSDTQVTLRDNYAGTTETDANPVFHSVYTITTNDPYPTSAGYDVTSNRLVYYVDNLVRFSEIEAPHDYTNQFDTENEHEIPEGLAVLGLGSVGSNLLIFTTGGTWTLQGLALDIVDDNGTPQHRLQVLSRDLILWGAAGISSWEQVLVVPCANGLYLMDGVSSPVLLSKSVEPLYTKYARGSNRPGGAAVYESHYLLPIVSLGGSVKEFLVCRLTRESLDRRRKTGFAWTRFIGDGAEVTAFSVRVNPPSNPLESVLLGAHSTSGKIIQAGYFTPSAALATDSDGTAHSLSVITRDFETGARTANVVRRLRGSYSLLDPDDEDPLIMAAWSDGQPSGSALWGQVNWGGFNWASASTAYYNIYPDAQENAGLEPHSWRVGKRQRYIRFRLRSSGACASYTLKTLELFIRPSQAVRK